MGVGGVAFLAQGGGVTSTTTCVRLWDIPLVERRKRRRRRRRKERKRICQGRSKTNRSQAKTNTFSQFPGSKNITGSHTLFFEENSPFPQKYLDYCEILSASIIYFDLVLFFFFAFWESEVSWEKDEDVWLFGLFGKGGTQREMAIWIKSGIWQIFKKTKKT